MAIIVTVIMSQSHTSQWSSVVYQYDFMLCEDAWYLRAGPRHGEVPPRGELKSAAAPQSKRVARPKPRVKAKSSLSGRNYFIKMHHQAGVYFENFTEVKFRDILLTGTGHRDRRLNRDSPGQTGAYGRSNLNQNLKPEPKSNFRFIRERPFTKVPPPRKEPPRRIASIGESRRRAKGAEAPLNFSDTFFDR